MSYREFSNLQNNPYSQTTKNKVPESILYKNSTPRKQTLIRNQSFENRQYNDDLIQLIAKIRSLEDDLLNQRFKNESCERKLIEYEKVVDNMQYEITSQNYQMNKYRHEIELSNEKNIQILKYEENLRYIGEEIEQLNNVLIKKNYEYDNLIERQKDQQYQLKKLEQQNHLLRISHLNCIKQLDFMIEEWSHNPNNSKEQVDIQKEFVSQTSFNNQNFNNEISKKIQIIRNTLTHYLTALESNETDFQKAKNQLQQQLTKEKQKQIKLQYQLKLYDQRAKDQAKKQDLVNLCYNDDKAGEIIEQLLKKEDEYVLKIEQLIQQNQRLKQNLMQLEESSSFAQKIEIKEKESIIKSLQHQSHILQATINQLSHKLGDLENRYESAVNFNESAANREIQIDIQMKKKIRKLEEDNHQYQIKIQELLGEISLLNKQIQILKGQE